MHPSAPQRAGHHLHRTGGIVAPAAHVDPDQSRIARGEQRRVPPEQAVTSDRGAAVGGGVEHHLDHAFDVTIHRGQRADVDAKSASDGRADGLDVELLSLDLAGLDDVLGQHRKAGLIAQGHADVGQSSYQQPLGAADVGQGLSQGRQVKAPNWPVAGLPDVGVIAATHAEIMRFILRMRKLFDA